MDIDFYYKGKNIELKTSLIPDRDADMDAAIGSEDIKLIRRGEDQIEDLNGDIHLQIFFNQKSKETDKWLKAQRIDLNSPDLDYLVSVHKT